MTAELQSWGPWEGAGAGSAAWEQVPITKPAIAGFLLSSSQRRDASPREPSRAGVTYSYAQNATHSEQKTKEIRFAKRIVLSNAENT